MNFFLILFASFFTFMSYAQAINHNCLSPGKPKEHSIKIEVPEYPPKDSLRIDCLRPVYPVKPKPSLKKLKNMCLPTHPIRPKLSRGFDPAKLRPKVEFAKLRPKVEFAKLRPKVNLVEPVAEGSGTVDAWKLIEPWHVTYEYFLNKI